MVKLVNYDVMRAVAMLQVSSRAIVSLELKFVASNARYIQCEYVCSYEVTFSY